jgi:hypothetical protein
MSEFLREQKGGGQVSEQEHGQDEGDDGVDGHGLPQLLAGLDVRKGHGEEDSGEGEHDEVLHGISDKRRVAARDERSRMVPFCVQVKFSNPAGCSTERNF